MLDKLNNLDYKEKSQVYAQLFSTGFLSSDLNEKLVLISLVSLAWHKLKQNNEQLTPLDILLQLTGETQSNASFYQFLESISIIVVDLSYGCTKFDSCGLTSSQEVLNKIKEILSKWLPF